jgi:hypothetical protein
MIKASHLLLAVSLVMTALQCRDLGVAENAQGRITVFVHWGDTPIAGKRVDLLQTGASKLTDANGLAVFVVPPGSYVIRVYGINRGGPAFLFVDFSVDVKAAESRTVDVVDCILCA